MKERAKQLANDHWNGYVEPMLKAHGVKKRIRELCKFHYISSAIHGHGHGVEDERNRAIQMTD